ncbi:hypothetical protein ACLB2K_001917 [Fragaria x ananassa]
MAVVAVGEDGDKATGQEKKKLWDRIWKVYEACKPPTSVIRSGGGCEASWRKIGGCTRWREALTKAKAAHASGENATDLVIILIICFNLLVYMFVTGVHLCYGRPHRFTVRIFVRSPPYGAGEGGPPPQRTSAASSTTFHPQRVAEFQCSDQITQNFKQSQSGRKTGIRRIHRGWKVVGEAAGVHWDRGPPSPAPYSGERTKIRT